MRTENLRKLEGVTGRNSTFPLIPKIYIFPFNGKPVLHPVTPMKKFTSGKLLKQVLR